MRKPGLPYSALHSPADPVGPSARGAEPLAATTWYVKRIHLRRLLSSRGTQRLEAASTLVSAPRRHLLFDPSGSGDTVWWIEEGRARLSRFRADGRELVAAVLEEGEIFGQLPRTAFATAEALVEVIESGEFRSVQRETFELVLDEEAEAAHAIAAQIAQQHGLADLPKWIGERDPRLPRQRVADVLALAISPSGLTELPVMSLQEWALLAGLPHPSLLEQLAPLVDAGLCTIEAGAIRAVDHQRLAALASAR